MVSLNVHQNVKRIVNEEVKCAYSYCTKAMSGRNRNAGGGQDPRWPDPAIPLNDP